MDLKTIGLIGNVTKRGAEGAVREVREVLERTGMKVHLEARTAELLGEKGEYGASDVALGCDLLVVLGGDGTLLQAVHQAGFPLPPVLGVNMGTLGFLTGVSLGDFPKVWGQVLGGEAVVSRRSLLWAEVVRDGQRVGSEFALNEVVLSRGERSRLIRLHVEIDGVALTDYNADGLIVATPTGSTAYSLSAGGPLLAPDSKVFVITPICPHVLTNRSVIVSEAAQMVVRPSTHLDGVCLTSDGRDPRFLDPGDEVRIRCAPMELRLVFSPEASFFELLRQKLRWSGTVI